MQVVSTKHLKGIKTNKQIKMGCKFSSFQDSFCMQLSRDSENLFPFLQPPTCHPSYDYFFLLSFVALDNLGTEFGSGTQVHFCNCAHQTLSDEKNSGAKSCRGLGECFSHGTTWLSLFTLFTFLHSLLFIFLFWKLKL